MRNNTLRNRMKAAFLTATLIASTLMGSMSAYADPTSDPVSVTDITDAGSTVTLPVSQTVSTTVTDETGKLVDIPSGMAVEYEVALTTPAKGWSVDPAAFSITDNSTQNLTFAFPHAGVYEATLTSKGNPDAVDAWNLNTASYHIRAYVKNDGKGGLTTLITAAEIKADGTEGAKVEKVAYPHTYGPCLDDPPIRKVVLNAPAGQKDTFRFQMYPIQQDSKPVAECPMPNGQKGSTMKAEIVGDGEHEFGNMYFDTVGTYKYIVEEEAGTGPYAYDSTRYLKTVVVTKGEDGNLTKTSSYIKVDANNNPTENGKTYDVAVFTNNYTTKPCTYTPQVEKIVNDSNGQRINDTTGQFTYHLEGQNGAPMPEGYSDLSITGSTSVSTDGSGKHYVDANGVSTALGTIRFTQAGTYTYVVTETQSSDGYARDTARYTITVTVTLDAATGQLNAAIQINGQNAALDDPTTFRVDMPANPPTNGGGGGPTGGGGGRRSRPETSNNPPTTPTTPGEVLGATRDAAEDAGRGVLGAVRNPQGQVLGAVRTGDSSAMVTWAVILMLAASGIVGWFNMYQRRKRNI